MTPERWQQIQELFDAVADAPPAERAARLETACSGDPELRREVESLLAHDTSPADFFEPLIEDAVRRAGWDEDGPVAEAAIGRRIGPYRVTGILGHGGMGSVFLAVRDDGQYRKQVAIKLIQPGMVSDFSLDRFRHERQILASLEHPHVARLLDGGATEEGLPYFVMEYVEGEPITAYCRSRELPAPARLQLFRQVCSAVHYAHQNLVIHRDLKPSNILVGRDGTPKLVDFGIAKLLHTDLEATATTQPASMLRMLTPDYASPEQLGGEPLTTATDVYSLGAVLYELLGGHRPRKVGGLVDNDLDAVVGRAMCPEPGDRYASVEQLADDLRRHLEGRPVTARGDSLGYRATKLVLRHKLAVAAAALAGLLLTGGILAVTYQARRDELALRAELLQAYQALCEQRNEHDPGCARLAETLARLGVAAPPGSSQP